MPNPGLLINSRLTWHLPQFAELTEVWINEMITIHDKPRHVVQDHDSNMQPPILQLPCLTYRTDKA
jgi:hypothetical protein